jgi:hypothetical protein
MPDNHFFNGGVLAVIKLDEVHAGLQFTKIEALVVLAIGWRSIFC